ncbi:Imm49 family immunity protein [Saccharopolyspora flava]
MRTPTALAALAHDRGFTVEVRSDYLPRNLDEPTWLSR